MAEVVARFVEKYLAQTAAEDDPEDAEEKQIVERFNPPAWCRPRLMRNLPSHQNCRKASRYINPYQWMETGPMAMATGSNWG